MGDKLISNRMKEEHGKMLVLLKDFVLGKLGAYEKLKDMQSRHAYAEEQAIFSFYSKKKDFKLLRTILEQHEELRLEMGDMASDKKVAKKFEKLMKEHIHLEDKKFYPMLDKELTPRKQADVLAKFLELFESVK